MRKEYDWGIDGKNVRIRYVKHITAGHRIFFDVHTADDKLIVFELKKVKVLEQSMKKAMKHKCCK